MAYEKLLSLVLNPEYGDITDSEEGVDLVIHYGKPVGASFPQTKITPRRKNSALCDEPERCKEMLENIPDFNTLFERKTPEEVGHMLDEFLAGEESAEERSKETTKYGDDKKTDVDAAFEELLGS